jgi:SAM-dependent methyltransferase
LHHFYSHDHWRLKVCKKCQFVYLENAPAYEELAEHFAWEKSFAKEKERREAAEPVLQWLDTVATRIRKKGFGRKKLLKLLAKHVAGGHVLDVGCGAGKYLAMLPRRYVPHGIEISVGLAAAASRIAVPRGGAIANRNALDALGQFESDWFSGIIMHTYLEHEANPKEVLKATGRVLRKGGALIIKVPNYASINRRFRGKKWCGFRFPDHVNYFTPQSLRQMLADTGFKVRRMNFADRLPTSDNMWAVAGKP